jgi:hypothetical protein
MLLILYIVQAICNQTLPPGTPTQLEQILLMFCFYLIYINLLDFFKMAAVAMETAKMLKTNEKHKNDYSRLFVEQKLMKLDRNNIHI